MGGGGGGGGGGRRREGGTEGIEGCRRRRRSMELVTQRGGVHTDIQGHNHSYSTGYTIDCKSMPQVKLNL